METRRYQNLLEESLQFHAMEILPLLTLTIGIISIYVTSLKLAKGSKVDIFVVQNC